MNLHPFGQAYYEVLCLIENIDQVEESCNKVVKYLNQLTKNLLSINFSREIIDYLIYSLSAIADYFILKNLNITKDITSSKIVACSVEVTIFNSAEAGKKLIHNAEKILLMGKNPNIMNLLQIYLHALSLFQEKTESLKQIQLEIYPLPLKTKDPFECKKKPFLNKTTKHFIYQKSLLLSLFSGYIFFSSLCWSFGVANLRSSIFKINQLL